MTTELSKIRNIGLMAHIDAGKTTTTERILFYTGKTYKLGEVDDGTAVMDWMPQEQERGITITSAATTSYWKSNRINIIDTPGHVDFTVEVERSLRVLDGAILVVCGVGGVEPQTETVWRQSKKNKVPSLLYINKLDRIGADFDNAFLSLKNKISKNIFAIQIPVGEESNFHAIIDLIELKLWIYKDQKDHEPSISDIPSEYMDRALDYRNRLLEFLADHDETILNNYLEGINVSNDLIKSTIRKLVVTGDYFPVLCGSSLKNKGVQLLLDAVIEYLPSPLDKPDVKAFSSDNHDEIKLIKQLPTSPFCALAFKIAYDTYLGRMVFVRVYSGSIKKGEKIVNTVSGKKERVSKLLLMHSNHQEEKDVINAGEICVFIGLKYTKTGDTLCSEYNDYLLEKMNFPEPVISMAIEPKSQSDSKKLEDVLAKLMEEDPTLKVTNNEETGQKILAGMGELHLEIIKDRILREYKLNIRVGNPQVAYRETISKSAQTSFTIDKILGGNKLFAKISLELIPLKRGEGISFEFSCLEKEIPLIYRDGILEALKASLGHGVSGLYSVIDVKVVILGGSFYESDTTDTAFKLAASHALEKALKESCPVLLEPVMKLEVITPDEFNGDIIGDLNSRRGKILDLDWKSNERVIITEVPLSGLFGYATVLRSISKGRASYSMEPFKFEIVPKSVEEKILGWMQIFT